MHKHYIAYLLAFFLSLSMAAVTAYDTLDDTAQHALLDTIWDAQAIDAIALDTLHEQVLQADIIILGEVHGNPAHHAIQLDILRYLHAQGLHPTLAFEIFDVADQPLLDEFRRAGHQDAILLGEQLGMADRGWPYAYYAPLVAHALQYDWPLLAVNLSRTAAMQVAREGWSALDHDEVVKVLEHYPLSEDTAQELLHHIISAHCGYLPASRAQGMVQAQQARDAVIALRMAQQTATPLVLITGRGHARSDYGSAYYLAKLQPERVLLSVALTEVHSEHHHIEDYLETPHASPFDILWLTSRSSPEDPCAAFHEQLKALERE